MTKHVPREADAGAVAGRIIILIRCVTAGRGQTWNVQALDAASINERVLSGIRELWIEVADVAGIIVKAAEHFHPQPEVQSKTGTGFPVILNEHREIISPIFVIRDPAAAEAEWRSALEKFLEVR